MILPKNSKNIGIKKSNIELQNSKNPRKLGKGYPQKGYFIGISH